VQSFVLLHKSREIYGAILTILKVPFNIHDLHLVDIWHHTGISQELYKFSVYLMRWKKLDTVTGPSRRYGQAMISVGRDIYLFWGYTNGGERTKELEVVVSLGVRLRHVFLV
jgi:hypothetical protein